MSEAFFATSALFKRYQKAGARKRCHDAAAQHGSGNGRIYGRKGDNRLVKGRNRLYIEDMGAKGAEHS